MLSCEKAMPFGRPVVPEVYMTVARSWLLTSAARVTRTTSSKAPPPWPTICSSERRPCRSAQPRETTTTSRSSGRLPSAGSTFASCSSSEATSTRAPEWRSM